MTPRLSSPLLIPQLLLLLLLPGTVLAATTTAGVVEQGRSAVFKQRVEVEVDGERTYSGAGVVEVSRYQADTLLILTTRDAHNSAQPLVSGRGSGRAVVVKSLGGRGASLLHHVDETTTSLNYKRSLASLLTPAYHTSTLAYHTQADVFGTCEVHYKHEDSRTVTWRDLTRCSQFSLELALGAHQLPLLHLMVDVAGSSSGCEYRWRGGVGAVLDSLHCSDTLLLAPRYSSSAASVLNITLSTSLTHTATAPFNSADHEYIQEATETTDLTYQLPSYQEDGEDELAELVEEVCSSEGDGRLTGDVLQKMSQLLKVLSRTRAEMPRLAPTCPANVRQLVGVGSAVVGGPRFLHFFVTQLAELSREADAPVRMGEDLLFTTALRSLVSSDHPAARHLPHDFFLRRENQMVYEELVDFLEQQSPPEVAGVAVLLEGLKVVSPQLFKRLLQKSAPHLSPEAACQSGDHPQAVRLLRSVRGLSVRPAGYVASLKPCFANDNVDVVVAAMDTLASVDCTIQGVTELQKLGLESPSDPEIRIAAYRGLVHCIPSRPHLLQAVAKALNPQDDAYSTQVASYVWSHVQSVISSEDPSLVTLRELMTAADLVGHVPDPVWYDPRQHSRHLSQTLHLDPQTSLTLAGDLVWGRYSPAPRALYLNLALHSQGDTHQLAQVIVRVTGVETMLVSLPGLEGLLQAAAAYLWSTASRLTPHAFRSKRQITHEQIADFIQQVMSRIPAEYRAGSSSLEVCVHLLGTQMVHLRLSDLRYSALLEAATNALQTPLHAVVLTLVPLLDNTLTLVTSCGVPVRLHVGGVAGVQGEAQHSASQDRGFLKFVASGGLSVETTVEVGDQQPAPIESQFLCSLDVPISASYEYEGEATRVSLRLPHLFTGRLWHQERHTSLAGTSPHLRVTEVCWGPGKTLQLCLNTHTTDHTSQGPVSGQDGWLAPYVYSLNLHMLYPDEPVVVTSSTPNMGGGVAQEVVVVVAGGTRFDASLVLQLLPSPTFVLTLNTPGHSYFLKGLAGSREGVTQMAGLELVADRARYAIRVQMSTPQLMHQVIWSPSVFITTPEGGEEEVVRVFLSLKEENEEFSGEFSLRTMGVAAKYLNLRITSEAGGAVNEEDGSLQKVEVRSLRVSWAGKLALDTTLWLYLGGAPHGQGSMKVGWGEEEGEVELSLAVGPQLDPGGPGGTSLKVFISGSDGPGLMKGSFGLLLDGGRVEVSVSVDLGGSGAFSFSHTHTDLWNTKTSSRVVYVPLEVWWEAEHEIVMLEDELRHWLNVSWAASPDHTFTSLLHLASNSPSHLDLSLTALVIYPGQAVELKDTLAQALGGSYKNKLSLLLNPGRTLTMDTIVITRTDKDIFSYGFSNTFKLDTWISPVSLVGTWNCLGKGQCSVVVTAEQAGDELLDLALQHTAAGGVSRSEAKIKITHWLDGTVSMDTASNLGYYDLKWRVLVWKWRRVVQGRAEVDLAAVDAAAVHVLLLQLHKTGQPGNVTHAYNGTLSLDQQARTLHVRQEVRVREGERNEVWVGVVQGRAGSTLLNAQHFAKATLLTPAATYYTVAGDAGSTVSGLESVLAYVTLSAGAGPEAAYLLTWDLDLQQLGPKGHGILIVPEAEEETDEEAEEPGLLMVYLETLLTATSPHTGEVKLNMKAKKALHQPSPDPHQPGTPTHLITGDVTLATETLPELARLHGKLSLALDTYTLAGRMWVGQRAVGVMSYAVHRNSSLKTSHLVTLVDPSSSWGSLQLALEADHLGTFPNNFQSSGSGRVNVGVEEAVQVQAGAQWTPSTSALNLALATYFTTLPGGNIFLKWAEQLVQAHAAWALTKGMVGLQWLEGGRALELALKYEHPGALLHYLDTGLTFTVSRAPYPPLLLLLASRFTLNTDHHYALNVDFRSPQEQYLVTGALVRPGRLGSMRLQVGGGGDVYGALLVLVLDGFSAQVTGAFRVMEGGEQVSATINSSLISDPRGYTVKMVRRTEGGTTELAALLSQTAASPRWIYTYRLVTEVQRDIKQKVRLVKSADRFTYHHLHRLLHDYRFLLLLLHNKFDEVQLEAEFPDLWPEVKMTGSVLKGKDTRLELALNSPSLSHLLHGRLIFSSSDWWSGHSGSLTYTQQHKKKRTTPLKLQVEASRRNSNRQKYKFFVQRTVLESPSPVASSAYETLYEYPFELYDPSGFTYDDPAATTTLEATLDVSRDPGTAEYKMSWKTDATKNEARVVLEEDLTGGGASLRYFRQTKGVPKSEVEYQLKGNYRRIDTELTISSTFDQSSVARPRAVIFLHSEAEGYTELLLDLFELEADQVILVVASHTHNLSFRIGQFGNTFLQLGYQQVMDGDGDTVYKVQVESSGRRVELWAGVVPEQQRTCTRGGLVLVTPTLAPTHHHLLLCPPPTPELTLQLLGVEEHEGPYLRVGQISGPGGVGVQVGSGRLRPLDTPPALTLTADVVEEVLEVLLDWQRASMAQLKEELVWRGRTVAGAARDLTSTRVRVQGALGLGPLLDLTTQLLHQALHLTAATSTQVVMAVLETCPTNLRQVLQVSSEALRTHLLPLINLGAATLDEGLQALQDLLDDIIEEIDDLLDLLVEEISDAYGVVEAAPSMLVEAVVAPTRRPPLLQALAAWHAITINDDQTLHALVSRVMGEVERRVGRCQGASGFLTNQLLTRLEKVLVQAARWEHLRAKGSQLLQHLRQVTTFSVAMPHSTALKIRVATPRRLRGDLASVWRWVLEGAGPRLLSQAELWLASWWARVRYLASWHVYGEAVVFGWDQAITWDGRQVTPLLTDSCHHMLVLLTHAHTPTALTIHLEDLSTSPRQVLTLFSGSDVVTLDSDLKMTYNSKHIRRPLLEAGELRMRWNGKWASVVTTAGLGLECEREQDLCRLTVTGEHFAATAGLLGVFDFDNNTDFMTSGWEMAATEEEWAQSWRVSTSEQCSSQLPDAHIPPSHGNPCTRLFHHPASPFRSCFVSVAAAPYLETCRSGWECGAEAAYLHACRRHYHALHHNLTSCSGCSEAGAEVEEELGTEDLALQVVVITDFECFDDIQDLVSALVRDDTRAHRVVLRYIGRGSPPSGPFEDVEDTIVDNGTPPLDAAINAATLDFSERALKAIVLFDCDHPRCTVSISAPKIVKLRETLLSQGVQLHVVTTNPITVLNRHGLTKKAMRQLIGVDGHTAYLLSHARKRRVQGKTAIRKHLTTPIGNTCTQLAVQTDGSVFSMQNIKMERKYHRRIFLQLLGQRLVEGQTAHYLGCRLCQCGAPCTLCTPPAPLVYSSSSNDDEDEEDDYEDDDEEELPTRRNTKKTRKRHRSSWP
nr:uncharacterized protein LOC123753944 [Procambarus clarkii]